MKIRSITDVITNSSTEVFLLDTTKSLKEVISILPKITEGYLSPVIMNRGDKYGPLDRSISWKYLYGEGEEEKLRYIFSIIEEDPKLWELSYEKEYPKDLSEFRDEFSSYMEDKIKSPDGTIIPKDFIITEVCRRHMMRNNFLKEFIEKIWSPRPLPEILKIPENLIISYWEGKIGFMGKENNSIPYETWDKITETFGGLKFHLG